MGAGLSLVQDIAEALADALTPLSPSQDIQVVPFRWFKPDPPCIDIYPATPFVGNAAFGRDSVLMRWIVRVRVGANDPEGQTDLLYEFMDPLGDLSIRQALFSDHTLGGIVDLDTLDQSGVIPYQDTLDAPVLPGCEWTVEVYNRERGAS